MSSDRLESDGLCYGFVLFGLFFIFCPFSFFFFFLPFSLILDLQLVVVYVRRTVCSGQMALSHRIDV